MTGFLLLINKHIRFALFFLAYSLLHFLFSLFWDCLSYRYERFIADSCLVINHLRTHSIIYCINRIVFKLPATN